MKKILYYSLLAIFLIGYILILFLYSDKMDFKDIATVYFEALFMFVFYEIPFLILTLAYFMTNETNKKEFLITTIVQIIAIVVTIVKVQVNIYG